VDYNETMKTMEQPDASGHERENDITKLEQFLKETADRYRAEGVPLGDDGRIDISQYKGLYPNVAQDMERDRVWEQTWFAGLPEEEAREQGRWMEGEQLEMLAYAILSKNLGDQFVVARASRHDDRANKVDTLILDKQTGNLVCAFDEVGVTSGPRYEEKQALVTNRNLDEGGASLKYGIGIREEEGKKKIVPVAETKHLPLFYLAVPSDRIKQGMKEFVADPTEQSEFEELLFTYFIGTISTQIDALKLYTKSLHPELRKGLDGFKNIIGTFNVRQGKKK
jgi:hypothetical protein